MSVHLTLPLVVTPAGRLATVAINSQPELTQSVAVLLDTRPGERRADPDYGLGDLLFTTFDADAIAEAIEDHEERAAGAAIEVVRHGESVHVTVTPPVDDEFDGDVDAYDPVDEEVL